MGFHFNFRIDDGSLDEDGPRMGQGDDNIVWVTSQDEVRKIKEVLNTSWYLQCDALLFVVIIIIFSAY